MTSDDQFFFDYVSYLVYITASYKTYKVLQPLACLDSA